MKDCRRVTMAPAVDQELAIGSYISALPTPNVALLALLKPPTTNTSSVESICAIAIGGQWTVKRRGARCCWPDHKSRPKEGRSAAGDEYLTRCKQCRRVIHPGGAHRCCSGPGPRSGVIEFRTCQNTSLVLQGARDPAKSTRDQNLAASQKGSRVVAASRHELLLGLYRSADCW